LRCWLWAARRRAVAAGLVTRRVLAEMTLPPVMRLSGQRPSQLAKSPALGKAEPVVKPGSLAAYRNYQAQIEQCDEELHEMLASFESRADLDDDSTPIARRGDRSSSISRPSSIALGGARTHRTTHLSFGLHPDLLPDRQGLVASFT
jgi:hypothetical protein